MQGLIHESVERFIFSIKSFDLITKKNNEMDFLPAKFIPNSGLKPCSHLQTNIEVNKLNVISTTQKSVIRSSIKKSETSGQDKKTRITII